MQRHSLIRLPTLVALALSRLSMVYASSSSSSSSLSRNNLAFLTCPSPSSVRPIAGTQQSRTITTTTSAKVFPGAFMLFSFNGLRYETTSADSEERQEWSHVLPYQNSSHGSVKVIVPTANTNTHHSQQLSSSETSSSSTDNKNPFDASTFRQRLEATIQVCREQKKSSIWVEVPMSRAALMEDMALLGFRFHHAQGDKANLNLWLQDDSECKIPEFATHHVGVGAVVVNSRQEILCVRELRNNYMPWKIPGGLAELGEHIDEAVVREVLEETGVPTKFVTILAFRHSHGMANGRSDLFFVCRLEPIEQRVDDETGNVIIPHPVAQQSEIEVAAWIPLSEYRRMVDDGHPMMRQVMLLFDERQNNIEKTVVPSIVPGRPSNPIYHPAIKEKRVDKST